MVPAPQLRTVASLAAIEADKECRVVAKADWLDRAGRIQLGVAFGVHHATAATGSTDATATAAAATPKETEH